MTLVLALSVLIALTAPMLALLSASMFEPLIARNQVDATQALYSAEAGIEWAFNLLVNTPDWNAVVPPSDGSPIIAPDGLLPWGTTTITVRRGTPPGTEPPSTEDADGVVTVTSTATVNGALRTVEAVVRRLSTSSQGIFDRHALVDWRER